MGFSQSLASWLVKGFESAAPAWLVQAKPCSFIRVNPSYPWFLSYESAANDFSASTNVRIIF